jgi:hypothetical protein
LLSEYKFDPKTKEFLKLGENIRSVAKRKKWLIEVINPQDGKSINSTSGEMTFYIVSIIHELPYFRLYDTNNGCEISSHPLQPTVIYPNFL